MSLKLEMSRKQAVELEKYLLEGGACDFCGYTPKEIKYALIIQPRVCLIVDGFTYQVSKICKECTERTQEAIYDCRGDEEEEGD